MCTRKIDKSIEMRLGAFNFRGKRRRCAHCEVIQKHGIKKFRKTIYPQLEMAIYPKINVQVNVPKRHKKFARFIRGWRARAPNK